MEPYHDADRYWQDYVTIDESIDRNSAEYKALVTVLEQISSTPEGRQLLKDAKEIQGQKVTLYTYGNYPSHMGFDNQGNPYININVNQTDALRYKGEDGKYHEYTLNRLLYHELAHAADPNLTQEALQAIVTEEYRNLYNTYGPADSNASDADVKRYVEEVMFKDPEHGESYKQGVKNAVHYRWDGMRQEVGAEAHAVAAENAYMKKYFGETGRVGYDGPGDVDMKGTENTWLYPEFPAPDASRPAQKKAEHSTDIPAYCGIDVTGCHNASIRYDPDGKSEQQLSSLVAELRDRIARDNGRERDVF